MKYKNTPLLGMLLSSLCITSIYADTPPSTPPETLKVSGFIDGSYNYLSQSNQFTSGVYDRVYDLNQNGVTLQQAAGTMSYLPCEGLGGLLNAMIGRDAIGSNAYGMGVGTDSPDFGVDITQGYVRLSHAKITFDLGKFVTLNGVESIAPITDSNFSRAILFGYAGPFTTTGIRTTYTANDSFKLVAGIDDGWDTVRDYSRGRTVELNASYTFNPVFTLATTVYTGRQRITDRTSTGPTGQRTLIDLVGVITATEKLSFSLNYDYAWQTQASLANGDVGRAIWTGGAGYINYILNDSWRTSLRGEVFNDAQGYRTGVDQVWDEITFTLAYKPCYLKHVEIRAEARHDFSNVASFLSKNQSTSHQNQQSFALEAFYSFG